MQHLKQESDRIIKPEETKISFGDATVHELKTLLTAIIVSAELLAEEPEIVQKSVPARLIQNIIRNAHSLDEKLAKFSEMAGLLTGDFLFEPEYLQLEPVIHSVTAQLYPITHSKKQTLTVELPASLPAVKAQRHYLEQILLNLLTNASKFTPEGGKITISASPHDRSLVIGVTDNGIGIPADKQGRLFHPYYKVNSHSQGSGLGLAITKFLVELHGGKVWVESTPGRGSRFFFSLPL